MKETIYSGGDDGGRVQVAQAQSLLPTISRAQPGIRSKLPECVLLLFLIRVLSRSSPQRLHATQRPPTILIFPLYTERLQISDSCVIYVTEEVIVDRLLSGGRQSTQFGSGKIQPFVICAHIEQSDVSANIP
jgi:hypothetical protein